MEDAGKANWEGPYLERWPQNPWDYEYVYMNRSNYHFCSSCATNPSFEKFIFMRLDNEERYDKIDKAIDDGVRNRGICRYAEDWHGPMLFFLIDRDGPVN